MIEGPERGIVGTANKMLQGRGETHKWPSMNIKILILLARVVRRLDKAIHQINRYPMDKC